MNLCDTLAVEVTATAVRVLRLPRADLGRRVPVYAQRLLPPELVTPSSTHPNVPEEPTFSRIVGEMVGARRPRAARLILPGRSLRLHVLHGDAVPAGAADLKRFMAWRLKDVVSFGPRAARVACVAGPNGRPGRQVALALVAREAVLAQYERLLIGLGIAVVQMASPAVHHFNLAARPRWIPRATPCTPCSAWPRTPRP